MNRDDIIRMAREAGFNVGTAPQIERFATLVAAAEREACAAWVSDTDAEDWAHLTPYQLAAAIRARGQA